MPYSSHDEDINQTIETCKVVDTSAEITLGYYYEWTSKTYNDLIGKQVSKIGYTNSPDMNHRYAGEVGKLFSQTRLFQDTKKGTKLEPGARNDLLEEAMKDIEKHMKFRHGFKCYFANGIAEPETCMDNCFTRIIRSLRLRRYCDVYPSDFPMKTPKSPGDVWLQSGFSEFFEFDGAGLGEKFSSHCGFACYPCTLLSGHNPRQPFPVFECAKPADADLRAALLTAYRTTTRGQRESNGRYASLLTQWEREGSIVLEATALKNENSKDKKRKVCSDSDPRGSIFRIEEI